MPEVLFLIKSLSWPERRNEGARERELWLTGWAPGNSEYSEKTLIFWMMILTSWFLHHTPLQQRIEPKRQTAVVILYCGLWFEFFFFFLRNGYCEINQSLITFCFSTLVSVAFLHFHMLVAVVFVSNEYMIFTTLNWLHLNFLIGDCVFELTIGTDCMTAFGNQLEHFFSTDM